MARNLVAYATRKETPEEIAHAAGKELLTGVMMLMGMK
jgi:hypothetical protein